MDHLKLTYDTSRVEFAKDIPGILLMGRSNVGKSSFINGLCGDHKIAKVSKTAGKTQTLNYFFSEDKSLCIIDAPGYGYQAKGFGKTFIYEKMFKNFEQIMKNLKIIVLIDSKVGITKYDEDIIDYLKFYKMKYVLITTKIDKTNQSQRHYLNVSLKELEHQPIDIFEYSTLKTEKYNKKIIKYILRGTKLEK